MARLLVLVPVTLLWASGCATVSVPLGRRTPPDDKSLRAAAERFYLAQTVLELRQAVDDAAKAGPGSALAHELAATYAQLTGQEREQLEHLVAALQDLSDDQPLLHLHLLAAFELTSPQRDVVGVLLQSLADGHPSPEVRAAAAFHLAQLLTAQGDFARRERLVASIDGRVALAWAGTWDNDQGKGFDLELAPEARPELSETYAGRTGPLTWRRDVPTDPRGRYELRELMSPSRWSAAFAQGTLVAEAAGTYALRLTTSDPLKVWVDGKLVFAAPQLDRGLFDQLVIPLSLTQGSHRLLVKSAHRDGPWHFLARLTPWASGAAPTPVSELSFALAQKVENLADGSSPARRLALLGSWTHLAAGGALTVKHADAFVRAAPRSIVARTWLVDALWYNQERGRTADLLQALDAELGDALAFLRLRQTRFHLQQGLRQRARDRLLAMTREHPTVREGWDQLAELWRSEGWQEDELSALTSRRERFGAPPEDRLERARLLLRLGRRQAAIDEYQALLGELPYHPEGLRRLAELRLEAGDLSDAERLLSSRLESWPVDGAAWLQLAEVRRRRGDPNGARAALQEAQRLSPESSAPWERRGALAYEAGDASAAVKEWKRAVELNPENESLANRVDFLAPEARGPWMADIPDEDALLKLVRAREQLAHVPGADVAWLLDHEVTLLNSDGSTSNVVTIVVHAWNAQGRDRIIRQSVGQGRLRVLHAYAVDEKGQRSEASSERNRQIFFRGMQPGSTLVLQYRLDAPPKGYLARYFTESWTFQGVGEQREDSTFILWMPLGANLHESRVGELSRVEERRGEQLRVTWQAKKTPPITGEPAMPTIGELALNIRVSTVPDWKTWLSWEQALLEGAFRESPELDAVAKRLEEGAPDAEERLLRVHTFVMEEIRYQQDYETFIAGVKPHPAPMTLERRYGDCKDKAVLFIVLARKLGLDAHFALVRTRDAGPVQTDVPMQQFNHAIVYVPEQPGVAARFMDPTAELLDVAALRADDAGTQSLVFDPQAGTHAWRPIPYQAPDANRDHTTLELTLDAQGGAQGTLTLESVGRGGSGLRRTARNAEVFKQATQRLASIFLPNATASNARALEVESLRVPAAIRVDVATGTFARVEGDSLRVKLPSDANPRATFQLATRKHPLVLGTPQQSQVDIALTLPEGWEVKKLPLATEVSLPCLSLSRQVKVEGRVVKTTQRYQTSCERLGVGEYAQYRGRLDDMVRLLDDELVLGAKGGKVPRRAPQTAKSR